MTDQTISPDTHPAPHRRNASFFSLGFGLGAAPLAWAGQSIVGYALSSYACFPGPTPRGVPLFTETRPILLALNVAAIILAVLGGAIAYRNWSATRGEKAGGLEHLVEIGEGRTRFLAMCGILSSVGFLVATIFSLLAIVLAPLCR
jgi:hypothetical protein